MRLVFFLFLSMSFCFALASDPPQPVVSQRRDAPPGLEGLVWNKWDTKHFSVLSISKPAGQSLFSSVESCRSDALGSWGIRGSDSMYCKLVCVPDADLLRKLFGLQEPTCEVRRSAAGKVESISIWVDSGRISLLPSLILEAELLSGDFPLFVRRGIETIESPSLSQTLVSAGTNSCVRLLDSKKASEYFKSDPAGFDASSAMLCLMVRKEYGRRGFSAAAASPSESLPSRLGFGSSADLDSTLSRYRKNLQSDISAGKTPDHYLRVGP